MKITVLLFVLIIIYSCNPSGKSSTSNKNTVDTSYNDTVNISNNAPINTSADDSLAIIKPDSIKSEQLIIPGMRIGQTFINERAEEVYKKLGKPDSSNAAMGKSLAFWNSKSSGEVTRQTSIYFTVNMAGTNEFPKVKLIRITSPYFRTKENIHVGAALDDIKSNFTGLKKAATYSSQNKRVDIYEDRDRGISFEIDPLNHCLALSIQEPGMSMSNTYLALHPGLKFF